MRPPALLGQRGHRGLELRGVKLERRELCRDRLVELILSATKVEKKRRPTKPTLGSKKRRLESKTKRGSIKAGRGKVECGLHTEMFRHKDVSELKDDFRIEPVEVKK